MRWASYSSLFHGGQYCCRRCEPRDTNARVREKGDPTRRKTKKKKKEIRAPVESNGNSDRDVDGDGGDDDNDNDDDGTSGSIYPAVACARDKDRPRSGYFCGAYRGPPV